MILLALNVHSINLFISTQSRPLGEDFHIQFVFLATKCELWWLLLQFSNCSTMWLICDTNLWLLIQDHRRQFAVSTTVTCQLIHNHPVFIGKPGVLSMGPDVSELVSLRGFADLTDVTLADEDTNSILTDNAKAMWQCNEAIWWPTLQTMQVVPSVGKIFN